MIPLGDGQGVDGLVDAAGSEVEKLSTLQHRPAEGLQPSSPRSEQAPVLYALFSASASSVKRKARMPGRRRSPSS